MDAYSNHSDLSERAEMTQCRLVLPSNDFAFEQFKQLKKPVDEVCSFKENVLVSSYYHDVIITPKCRTKKYNFQESH